jgi:hypothetical protein
VSWPIRGLPSIYGRRVLGRARAARVQQRGHLGNGSYIIGAQWRIARAVTCCHRAGLIEDL